MKLTSAAAPDFATGARLPWFEAKLRQNRFYVIGLLICLATATLVIYYLPPLARADMYTDDMCEHVSWYYSAANPALFQNDLVKDYFTAMSPMGYRALFSTVCVYVDPRVLGEILSLLLGAVAVVFAYLLGRTVTAGSMAGGVVGVLLLLFGNLLGLHEFIKVFQGGLQRAFALPILLYGVWALLTRRTWLLSTALILAALFYPPVCISLAAYTALIMGWRLLKRDPADASAWREALIAGGASILSAGLLFLAKAMASHAGHWTLYTLKDAIQMPEFYPGGIWDTEGPLPILYHKWTDYFTEGLNVRHPFLVLVMTFLYLWQARQFRTEIILLMVSALLTWGVAYLTLLNLFEPSRYIPYPLMTLWLMIVPGTAWAMMCRIKPGYPAPRPMGFRIKFAGVAVFVVLVISGAGWLTIWRIQTAQGGVIGTAPAGVYHFLHTLPTNVKIAAHPMDANDIPMRSQRSVLAFGKAMWPYHREFYEEMKARISATLRAMYATNDDDVLALRHRFGADVLVINTAWYRKEPIKTKPYDSIEQTCRAQLRGATPLVLHAPRQVVMYQQGSFIVLDLARWDQIQNLQVATMQKPHSAGP